MTATLNGQRLLLADLSATKAEVQAEAIPLPRLRWEPVELSLTDASRRPTRARIHELEDAVRTNLRAAQEARVALFEEHHRLVELAAARAQLDRLNAQLIAANGELRDEESARGAQLKARALREGRAAAAKEIEEAALELARLRDGLQDHEAVAREYAARLRDEQKARVALQDRLEAAEAARARAEQGLERAAHGAKTHTEEREKLMARLDVLSGDDAVAALADDLQARDEELARRSLLVDELTAQLEAERVARERAESAGGGRVAELEAAVARAEQRAGSAERTAHTLGEQIRRLEQERESAMARLDEGHAELVRAESAREAATASADSLRAELEAARTTCAAGAEEIDRLRAVIEEQRTAGAQELFRRSALAELSALAATAPPPESAPNFMPRYR